MKFLFVFGTRPEFIKLQPLIIEAKRQEHNVIIVHSGQHFSSEMNEVILTDLNLSIDYQLSCGNMPRAEQISKMLYELPEIYYKEKPDVVIAQGDTNTVLATALSASSSGFLFAHIESGIRSFDRTMPEEVNRVLVDQISDFLFAPTKDAVKNLKQSECNKNGIYLVGNTIVDAVLLNKKSADKLDLLKTLGLEKEKYAVFTMHRAENVDNKERLFSILKGIELSKIPFIFPMHPRTEKMIAQFALKDYFESIKNIKAIKPLGFFEFLNLCSNARLIVSDSGGIQEEASIYKKPVVVIRDTTERPEILGTFGYLVGADTKKISNKVKDLWASKHELSKLPCPYGDGKTSEKIIEILSKVKK